MAKGKIERCVACLIASACSHSSPIGNPSAPARTAEVRPAEVAALGGAAATSRVGTGESAAGYAERGSTRIRRFENVRALQRAPLEANAVVELVGYAQEVQTYRFETPPCNTCEVPLFSLADERYSIPTDRVWVDFEPALVLTSPFPRNRDYLRVRARISERPGPRQELGLIRYEILPPPSLPALEPSYADGSWSIRDLYRRPDLSPNMRVAVTAFVYRSLPAVVSRCDGRTKNGRRRTCPLSVPPMVLIADSREGGVDSLQVRAKLAALPAVGGPYFIVGVFGEPQGDDATRQGTLLMESFRANAALPPMAGARENSAQTAK